MNAQTSIHLVTRAEQAGQFDAILIAQDRSLLMDPESPVTDVSEDYDMLERDIQHDTGAEPGSLLVRKDTTPLRLWMVIHDIEQSPSWDPALLRQALSRLPGLASERNIHSVMVPMWMSHDRDYKQLFPAILQEILQNDDTAKLDVWLVYADVTDITAVQTTLM